MQKSVTVSGSIINTITTTGKFAKDMPYIMIDDDRYIVPSEHHDMPTTGEYTIVKDNNKYNMVNTETGDIEYEIDDRFVYDIEHAEKRVDDMRSLYQTMRHGRDLINANVTDKRNCKLITITYRQDNGPMTDTKQLYDDVHVFMQKMKRHYGKFEYITAVEPQGSGAWHEHIIMIFDHPAPFIPNNEIEELWGHGFVKTTSLQDVDNVGAYLTAHLTNHKMKNPVNAPETHGVIKGARMILYPAGMRIFRNSRGVKQPVTFKLENEYQELSFNEMIETLIPDEKDIDDYLTMIRYKSVDMKLDNTQIQVDYTYETHNLGKGLSHEQQKQLSEQLERIGKGYTKEARAPASPVRVPKEKLKIIRAKK